MEETKKDKAAKVEKVEMFEITVEGQFAFGDRRNTDLEFFKEVFVLPFSGGQAQSQIRKKLIAPRLKATKKQFKFVRTCGVTEVKETKGALLNAKDVAKMTFEQLSQFSAENTMIVIPTRTANIEEARKLVQAELERNALAGRKTKKSNKAPLPDNQMAGDRGMEFDEILK